MTWENVLSWLLGNAPALIISVVALVISVKSWYKTRIYYDLEVCVIAGTAGNTVIQLDAVKEKLNTGKYTIIDTFEETAQSNGRGVNRVSVLIGKIKK